MAARFRQTLTFEPPSGWLDATVSFHHAPPTPPGDPPAPSLSVYEEPVLADDTLETHAHRVLLRLTKDVSGFRLLHSDEGRVGGQPAVVYRFLASADGREVEQLLVVVPVPSTAERKVAVFVSASALPLAEATRAAFSKVLETVRFDASPAGR